MSPYRGISLASFFGCAPAIDPNRAHHPLLYTYFEIRLLLEYFLTLFVILYSHHNGIADYAPYGLRKVEASLVRDGYSTEDVVVAHPDYVEKFIGPETEVVGTYEMDPLGMGPVTMTFTYGRKQMSYDEFYNRDLHMKIKAEPKKRMAVKQKLLQVLLEHGSIIIIRAKIEEYGLYGIVEGDLGGIGPEIDGAGASFFDALINGEMDTANPFKKNKFKVEIKEFERDQEVICITVGLFIIGTNPKLMKFQP